jgi:hypothetical protein
MTDLGRLQRVDLRDVWSSESSHFTPWLAQKENLALLGDAIGLDLDLDATEKNVGPFRADIVCRDTINSNMVIIENQLERTDHSHLGQLLTYAAGLDAVTIVWVAERFTDEHRAALDWLNEVTEPTINLFGLEIELWRIGTSPIAPKFNVVSQPNDWTKTLSVSRQQLDNGELSEIRVIQIEYWTALKDYLEEQHSFIKAQKPFPQHWTSFAVGRSNFHIDAFINQRERYIGLMLVISGPDAKTYYKLLLQDKAKIEAELGEVLTWRELPNRKQSDTCLYKRDVEVTGRETWPEQHAWLHQKLEAFHRCFAPRIKALRIDTSTTEGDNPPTI